MPTAGQYFLSNGIHSQKGMINVMIQKGFKHECCLDFKNL